MKTQIMLLIMSFISFIFAQTTTPKQPIQDCTCNGRTFLLLYTDEANIFDSLIGVKDIDQCYIRNTRQIELQRRLFQKYPEEVIATGDGNFRIKADGQINATLEREFPNSLMVFTNVFTSNPELIRYEKINLNNSFARERAGIKERDLTGIDLPIPDYILSAIAKLNIPDKCYDP